MCSQELGTGICSTAASEERARFFANLSEGLHAMAQPLTILRSTVAASAAPGIDATKQQRYLDISSQQIARACRLFEFLEDLVIASQMKADCAPIELPALLTELANDQRVAFETAGAELRVVMPRRVPTVLGDVNRTQQALSTVLKLAASVSAAEDSVELLVTACGKHMELIIRNDRVHGRSLNSWERLTMSLAQENILSQRGEFQFVEDPFWTRVRLPIQFSEF